MIVHWNICILFLYIYTNLITNAQETAFDQNYVLGWGGDHVNVLDQGREVQIKIDPSSGGGFKSKRTYTSGIFKLNIKIPKDSSGIVTTFYLTSLNGNGPGEAHDELDFEILGQNGPPYKLSTNIFAEDNGGREQQFKLWFDPTLAFHEYKFIWNHYQIVFLADGIPIRVYENLTKIGAKYPRHSMRAYATMWNSTQWLGPTDWSRGSFYADFREFAIEGCSIGAECDSSRYSWKPSPRQEKMYEEMRKGSVIYDYCKGKTSNDFQECKMEKSVNIHY